MDAARLSVQHLQTAVSRSLSFRIDAGQLLCLSGPSGAGKTLLLRALADLDPNEGEVRLDGRLRESFRPAQWRRNVGFLPAESQWWAETVEEHFPDGPPYLEALGLPPSILQQEVTRCSTGERQRLALARLLVNCPRVLLLDEPTASLDRESVARVERVIADFRHRHRPAILWVSHDPTQIERLADSHLKLDAGRLTEVLP